MKNILFSVFLSLSFSFLFAQGGVLNDNQHNAIHTLINKYAEAREKSDTMLLKTILTTDVDQLVSNGEWRNGVGAAVQGMLRSSAGAPGTRTLAIEKIRMIGAGTAIVDCRYEIKNTDGTIRKMWSTFLVVMENRLWKICAIRNMMPASS